MFKILRRTTFLALLLTAVLVISSPALAAPPAPAAADISDVIVTNNYGISDTVEIILTDRVSSNTAFWLYLADGPTDTSAQIGTVTVKKNTSSAKITIAAGKLSDIKGGTLVIKPATGTGTHNVPYDKAPETSLDDTDLANTVSLRNCPTGAEVLIVDKSIVKKGMTVYAVINGRIFKGVAKADNVELQVALAANMEIDTPVWYTLAYAGCMDVGYRELLMGDVEKTTIDASIKFNLFFQGDGIGSSSLSVVGVSPGNKIICTYTDGKKGVELTKTATVANSAIMANVTGLNLNSGDTISVTITEKGKLESDPKVITVPGEKASKMLKTSQISVTSHTKADDTATESTAEITIKGLADGDTIKMYDATGAVLVNGQTAVLDDAVKLTYKAELGSIDLEIKTPIVVYFSVTSTGCTESVWLKYTMPTPKIPVSP